MRVWITGVCGFIGSHLAEAYETAGHKVAGVDTLETGLRENWPWFVHADVADRARLEEAAAHVRPELILHCAASYKDPEAWERDVATNVTGAANVAAVARTHRARLTYFQTVLPPISSYAASKLAGERYLRLARRPLSVYRLASVYGPRNLSGPVPTFYRQLRAGEACHVVRDASRDFVYVDDLVRLVLSDTHEEVDRGVRSGTETPISVLPALLAEAMEVEPTVRLHRRRPDDVARYEMNGPPLAEQTPLVEGIARAVAWYDEHGIGETYTHLTLARR